MFTTRIRSYAFRFATARLVRVERCFLAAVRETSPDGAKLRGGVSGAQGDVLVVNIARRGRAPSWRERNHIKDTVVETPEQVARLKDEYSVYMVGSSRVNVAGVNPANIDYVVDAVAAVL